MRGKGWRAGSGGTVSIGLLGRSDLLGSRIGRGKLVVEFRMVGLGLHWELWMGIVDGDYG